MPIHPDPQSRNAVIAVPDYPIVTVPGRQGMGQPLLGTTIGPDSALVGMLQKAFDRSALEVPEIHCIVAALRNAGLTFGVLGGWVRDQVLSHLRNDSRATPKDIDFVVLGANHATLEHLLPSPTSRTLFGGFTFHFGQFGVDLWGADDTYLTRRLGIPSDLRHVLSVTDFNINAVVFLPSQTGMPPWILDGGGLDSLRSKEIAFHCEFLVLPTAQVARLLEFSLKLGFSFDEGVRSFILRHCASDEGRRAVHENLRDRHPPLRVQSIMDVLDALLQGSPP